MCSPELSAVLAKLHNKCLAKACFPSCWKSSSVCQFLKMSTTNILTVLSERIYNSLDAGGEPRTVALNKVWHAGLLHKLKSYGVVGPILNILVASLHLFITLMYGVLYPYMGWCFKVPWV